MVKFQEISGWFNFVKAANQADKSTDPVYVFFYGGPSDSDSWCPDCNKAKPVINEVVKSKASENTTFIHVNVGGREQWKSSDCEFRTSTPFAVSKIPTLVKWDTKETLIEDDCADKEKVEAFFK